MIPLPVTSTRHRVRIPFYYTRARLSNAALCLLLSCLALSVLFNFFLYIHRPAVPHFPSLSAFSAALTRDNASESLNHLIIVTGHAIWIGTDPSLRLSEDQWLLEPYQKGQGRLDAFFAHISRGADLAVHDRYSLLVFSGGQTKKASTTTEAESYLRLALYSNLFGASGTPATDFSRTTTENYALDSYQNLLFSIARFHEYTGRFPENITVIGYEFKRQRFVHLHRPAIRWPSDRFHYIGVDATDESSSAARQGEWENGYKPYSEDLYGCHSFLASKRRQRNPHSRFHPYYSSALELTGLFDWCPATSALIFSGTLPWDRL
ncbi:hypothetical protein M378DRAFT_70620 [Amanita muscaria Koide BX008]|uniref:DUF218 domain-containing protein n=1 Tax=Amanita muscaria (strain Koide BX008) TaxID=946122 RepID=A0A0C2SZ92_AMAMK|nr:hypothetical protein M378DRAFT_70620 [Amanita muscaria Koide BX008]